MALRPMTVAGALLVAIGVLLMTGLISQATVTYTGPTVVPLNPSGTYSSPTPIAPGAVTILSATISDPSGISKAQCQVVDYAAGTNQSLFTLGRYGDNWVSGTWTVPTAENKYWACVFTAWNTAGGWVSSTAYFKTTTVYPSGDFFINNEKATTTSVHTVSGPALSLKFVALLNGNKITSVTCKLYNYGSSTLIQSVTLTETDADVRWTGSMTLPAPGKYTLNGYVTDGTTSWQLMSCLITNTSGGFTSNQMLGVLFSIVGTLLIAKDMKLIKL